MPFFRDNTTVPFSSVISRYFWEGLQNDCKLLLLVTSKHVLENFGGPNSGLPHPPTHLVAGLVPLFFSPVRNAQP